MGSYYNIDVWGLVVAALLAVVAAVVSMVMRLGMAKSLLWSVARSLVQLLAMGFILEFVIRSRNLWYVLALIVVMIVAATQITMSRAKNAPKELWGTVTLSLAATMLLMLAVTAEAVIRPHPWYDPQLIVPLAGMFLGNTVSALAVAMSRFFESMKERQAEITTMLALGATPWEASKPSILSCIRLGMLPTIASLASSGIVTIPGMMAGQIIAGKDPISAAKYQFVILTSISALTLIADSLILPLIYRKCFIAYDRYQMPEVSKPQSSR